MNVYIVCEYSANILMRVVGIYKLAEEALSVRNHLTEKDRKGYTYKLEEAPIQEFSKGFI